MAYAVARESKTRMNISELQIGMLVDNLFRAHPIGEQLKDVAHAYAHTPHAWATSALSRVHGYAFKHLCHRRLISMEGAR